jgi:hypothetical protein
VQKTTFGVQREAPTYERLNGYFRFRITRGHVDDKPLAFAVYNSLQGFEHLSVVVIHDERTLILRFKHSLGVILKRGQHLQG